MEDKKAVKISLGTAICIFIIIVLIVALGVVYYLGFVKNKLKISELKNEINGLKTDNDIAQNIEEKTNKESEIIEKENITVNNSNNNTAQEKNNLDTYLGMWYESENQYTNPNPNNLNIKNVSNNKLLMDMYITRTADFDNFEVTLNENLGTFEALTDNGGSSDGQSAKINGKIEFTDNAIKVEVLKSNVLYIESGNIYTFKYHIKNSNIDNYKGTWYESQAHSDYRNPNSLSITKIDNNKIIFDLYITRTANFDNVVAYISNNFGTFEAITDNGRF